MCLLPREVCWSPCSNMLETCMEMRRWAGTCSFSWPSTWLMGKWWSKRLASVHVYQVRCGPESDRLAEWYRGIPPTITQPWWVCKVQGGEVWRVQIIVKQFININHVIQGEAERMLMERILIETSQSSSHRDQSPLEMVASQRHWQLWTGLWATLSSCQLTFIVGQWWSTIHSIPPSHTGMECTQ